MKAGSERESRGNLGCCSLSLNSRCVNQDPHIFVAAAQDAQNILKRRTGGEGDDAMQRAAAAAVSTLSIKEPFGLQPGLSCSKARLQRAKAFRLHGSRQSADTRLVVHNAQVATSNHLSALFSSKL